MVKTDGTEHKKSTEELTDGDFIGLVKGMARSMAPTLEPDDDWMPTLFVDGELDTGERGIHIAAIDPSFMSNEENKEELFYRVMPQILISFHAYRAVFICTSWALHPTKDQIEADPHYLDLPPSQHPDREEYVFATWVSVDAAGGFGAKIIRHDDSPPTLSKWKNVGDTRKDEPAAISGRIIDPMRHVLGLMDLLRKDPAALLKTLLLNSRGDRAEIIEAVLEDPNFQEWARRRRAGEEI